MKSRMTFAPLALVVFMLVAVQPAFAAVGPANDDFANAQVLTGANGTTSGTNVDATGETGEPANHAAECCDPDLGDASVWYKWTAPSSGVFAFDTFVTDELLGGIEDGTVLGVYTGSAVNALTEVNSNQGFNDDYGGRVLRQPRGLLGDCHDRLLHRRERVLRTFSDRDQGAFTLNWASATRPANDNFASATTITGATWDPALPDQLRRVAGDGRVDCARSWRRSRWRIDLVLVDGAEHRRFLVHRVVDLALRRRVLWPQQLHTRICRLHGEPRFVERGRLRRQRRPASPSGQPAGLHTSSEPAAAVATKAASTGAAWARSPSTGRATHSSDHIHRLDQPGEAHGVVLLQW